MNEVAHLAAVFENPWHVAGFQLGAEDGCHPRVRRIAWHVRAVDIVIAHRDHRPARRLGPRQRVMLLRGLARRIQTAWPKRRVLADQPPPHRLGADRAAVLEDARRRGRHACAEADRRDRVPGIRSGPARRPPSTRPAPAAGSPPRTSPRATRRWRSRCGCRRTVRLRRRLPHPRPPPGGTPRRHRRERCDLYGVADVNTPHTLGRQSRIGAVRGGSIASTATTSWSASDSAAATRVPMNPAAPVSSTLTGDRTAARRRRAAGSGCTCAQCRRCRWPREPAS